MNALGSLDWSLAVYVASIINGDDGRAVELQDRLANLGVPSELLDDIRRGAGKWSVSDDDHTDVIVAYAAKFSRTPPRVEVRDIERLESIGLTRLAIADLNSSIAFVNHTARASDRSQ